MIKEVGIAIKIPKNKVKEVIIEERNLSIHFLNGLNEMDKLTLYKVDAKVVALMGVLIHDLAL